MKKLYFSDDFSDSEKDILSATLKSNMDTLKIKDINFQVLLKKENMHPDLYGYTTPLTDDNKKFGISVNSKNDLLRTILTLGHEMIHVEQHLHHKLRFTPYGIFWKDKFIPDIIATDMSFYPFLPWEIEAHKYDKNLYSIAMKDKKID